VDRSADRGGVPCGPINDVAAALAEPQTLAANSSSETDHATFGQRFGSQAGANRSTPAAHRRAPQLGEHTESILREVLGYDAETFPAARADGAFGERDI